MAQEFLKAVDFNRKTRIPQLSEAVCAKRGLHAGIGRALKEATGYDLVIPCCLTNGSEGYFPMEDAYAEGGYEARSSSFKAGVAEFLIEEGINLLNDLHK